MKRAACFLLLTACAGLGCESLPRLWDKPKPADPAATVAQTPKPIPMVKAEDVNEVNAQTMGVALMQELDRESQGEVLPAGERTADGKPADVKRK